MEGNKFSYKYYEYPSAEPDRQVKSRVIDSLDYLGFYICEKGHARITIDNRQHLIGENCICVVLPYSVISDYSHSDDFVGYGAKASNLFIHELFVPNIGKHYSYIRNNPCAGIGKDSAGGLKSLLKLINAKLAMPPHPLNSQIIQNLLIALAYEIIFCYENNDRAILSYNSSRQDDIFRDFMSLVSRDHMKNRRLDHYAGIMCLTTRYLSQVIKQKTGKNATYWINITVISEAKNMLRNSDLSIQQISDDLCFANPSFFGQYFKKHAGLTPLDYRRGKD